MTTHTPEHSASQPEVSTRTAAAASGVTELTDLGVIRAVGEEAAKFLQGQLTQDVVMMPRNQARLAAFCNAKGRMQASFVVFKRSSDEGAQGGQGAQAGEEILMVCSRDILTQTLKRLSMFVMRAKVKLSDASSDYSLFGLAGDAVQGSEDAEVAGALDTTKLIAIDNRNHWAADHIGTISRVFLYPGAGIGRALWCAPAGTPRPIGGELPAGMWQWLEVQSGVAMVTAPIFEAFVPQMLNYESIGGVNFKKGCYPGQEVVARSQFRGTLKRRAYVVHGEHGAVEPVVGVEVFQASDPEQPCGWVAACAASPFGGFDAIVSMQTSAALAADGTALTLGGASGPALSVLPLPYPLLEDI